MKSVGSCYLFFNISSHRHTVGKGTCELFQVGFGYITSPSPRRLRCFHVVIVFYRRRGYRRRMQLLLVGGMHCSMLMLMLLEFRRPFNTISIYFYINFYKPHKSAPYFSRRLFLTCCNPREIAALSSFNVDWLLYMNV